ncbi:hypothetical protein C1645_826722 [Glomus cerebriforme]|uniref:HMG box domain-containing protein n=1 Tax=Glomus cerebriforme TaxID=658196 RepID=A0A397SUC2_9GLOM|nr:hypothetical protein C1645_826722 [Glomus cerebriforme]
MFSPNQNNNQRGYAYTLNINYDGDKTLAPPPPPDPKQTIRFDVKSDEERARKVTPPRRQNAWIIYRKDKSKLPEFRGKHSSEVSVKIREMWNNESKEETRRMDEAE